MLKSGRVFIVFEQTARRGATVLATATVKAGCIDTHRFVPAAMPAELLDAFRTLPGSLRTLMTPTADLSILSLITKATVVVQFVMLLLAVLSIASWTAIFQKGFAIKRAKRETEEFERQFWGGAELSQLYQQASNPRRKSGTLERIFEAGMSEFLKLRGRGQSSEDRQATLDGARRAMRASYQREMDGLESRLNFLASVGSVSPYIGLFGTVWGIMHAFTGLSNLQQANLASVAPGIAEALVATAIGLFAAIPAVVAYNRFANDIDRLANRFESFMEEFLEHPAAPAGVADRWHWSRAAPVRRRRMMADINVVPYVDVMLVLVVILMVAAPFVNPSVVDLPVGGQGRSAEGHSGARRRAFRRTRVDPRSGQGRNDGPGGTVDRVGEVAAEERRHTGGHRG